MAKVGSNLVTFEEYVLVRARHSRNVMRNRAIDVLTNHISAGRFPKRCHEGTFVKWTYDTVDLGLVPHVRRLRREWKAYLHREGIIKAKQKELVQIARNARPTRPS